ncbi:DUF4349 domain-containing protein [bacterium]|nr:DUF4349 domain-containing protein [bacterium]
MADCEQWREAISAWLDGQCSPQEEKEVQAHLDACPACRAWAEQVEADRRSFISSLMGRQADISQDVMRRVSEMSVEPKEVAVPRRRPSFGLVELLVVLGICGVLAAVLFPVFSKAREKARQPSCLSNVRQLALATLQYAHDYDDVLPPAENWAELIQRYHGNTQILHCPSAIGSTGDSYALVSRWGGMPLKSITDPGNTIIIYEAENGQPAYRHNEGMNVGYADGHGKWIKKLPSDVAPITAIAPGAPDNNYGLRRRVRLAYDASCEVWVRSLQSAVVAAEQTFYDRGGFVLHSALEQGGVNAGQELHRSARVEGKVPTAEVGATINALAALGYVARREISGADMTDQYVTGSRAVTQTEEELGQVQHREAVARTAQKPALQEQTRAVRQQLGAAQDALFGVEREVALATITATLIERGPQAAVSAGQIGRAWSSFVHTAGHVGVVLVWVGLYGLFLTPVVVVVWVWRKRRAS